MEAHRTPEKTTTKSEFFAEKLHRNIRTSGSFLCVGIDPPLSRYGRFLEQERQRLGPRAFLERFGTHMVEAAAERVPAVKVQSAFFEAYGADGFAALETVLRTAREHGLLTILDAKRGDISSTMAAYGHMAFETMAADALTITPYMGLDILTPLWPWLKAGKGVYVVWVSSNPSGALVQDPVADQLLGALHHAFRTEGCEKALGLVLGATKVDQLSDELFSQLARFPLLMPGVGAQGGTITARILQLKNQGCPILVPESRSLMEKALQATCWDNFKETLEAHIATEAKLLQY